MRVEEWLGADNQIGIDIWHKKYQNGNDHLTNGLTALAVETSRLKLLSRRRNSYLAVESLLTEDSTRTARRLHILIVTLLRRPKIQ